MSDNYFKLTTPWVHALYYLHLLAWCMIGERNSYLWLGQFPSTHVREGWQPWRQPPSQVAWLSRWPLGELVVGSDFDHRCHWRCDSPPDKSSCPGFPQGAVGAAGGCWSAGLAVGSCTPSHATSGWPPDHPALALTEGHPRCKRCRGSELCFLLHLLQKKVLR